MNYDIRIWYSTSGTRVFKYIIFFGIRFFGNFKFREVVLVFLEHTISRISLFFEKKRALWIYKVMYIM